VLLVEQEVTLAFEVCPRALVLEAGRIIASGESTELARSETVRKAYFGDLAVADLMTGPTDPAMTEVSR
jgi:branched-chain amino acid transport system ATP-binding protein